MFFKAILIHKDKIITLAIFLGSGGIRTPLFQPRHFLRKIKLFPTFGFDNPDYPVCGADDEIRCVIREVAVGFDVVEFETDGKIVFGELQRSPWR